MKINKTFRARVTNSTLTLIAVCTALSISLVSWLFVMLSPVQAAPADHFVTTWKTDNLGSSNDTSITIPTIGTGYNYDVDWDNDGVFDELGISGSVTHDFDTAGTYTIRIQGSFPRIYFNNSGDKEKIISINQWGTGDWASMSRAFYGASNLINNATDAPNLTNVTRMDHMFNGASRFNADLSGWNVSSVTSMHGMFQDASSFDGNLSGWDVSNVTSMSYMFAGAIAFNRDLSSWNTGNVTLTDHMFSGASSFNGDLSNWDVGSVVNMVYMFANARSFNGDISSWNTGNVGYMRYMFMNASSFNGDISAWNTNSLVDMTQMFNGASSFNSDLSTWDVSGVTDMRYLFSRASSFNGDISAWNTSSVTDMSRMFYQASSFNNDISGWNTGSVTNMSHMFNLASSFNADITTWSVGSVVNMENMFAGASTFDQNIGKWDMSSVELIDDMFGASSLSTSNYDLILTGWSTQQLQNGVILRASGRIYCNAAEERQLIIDTYAWLITNDINCVDVVEKKITSVDFAQVEGKSYMKIIGTALVGGGAEVTEVLSRSFVTLNGVVLPMCTFGGMTEQDFTDGYGVPPELVSDSPTCYQYSADGLNVNLTADQAIVWLSSDFDTTAPGTVSVNGSPIFTFNQSQVGQVTITVEGKPLTGRPTIDKRPVFSGTATPGAEVTVTFRSEPVSCTTTVDENGNWSCTLPSDLAAGSYNVYVAVSNPDGSTQELGPYAVTVAGGVGSPGTINDDTPIVPGVPNTGFTLLGMSQPDSVKVSIMAAVFIALAIASGIQAVLRRRTANIHFTKS